MLLVDALHFINRSWYWASRVDQARGWCRQRIPGCWSRRIHLRACYDLRAGGGCASLIHPTKLTITREEYDVHKVNAVIMAAMNLEREDGRNA
ncbi:hypothetical protein CCR95_17725 [Thiocystis minor]|nr:hypothetical protein [Thiocystis minor]